MPENEQWNAGFEYGVRQVLQALYNEGLFDGGAYDWEQFCKKFEVTL